jgi:putative DNA primase/helicase
VDASDAAASLGYLPKGLQGRCLVVPIESGGKLSSLQLVDGDGRKHFLASGALRGAYWASQTLPDSDTGSLVVLIGEGST